MSEFHGCNACGSPENWEKLLKEAHDEMDELNNKHDMIRSPLMGGFSYCNFCLSTEYDSNGFVHDDDCILVKIRHVIHT